MEDQVVSFLMGINPWVAMVLVIVGSLIVVAEAVVVITPTLEDDEAWAKIKAIPVLGGFIAAIAKLAPIQKK